MSIRLRKSLVLAIICAILAVAVLLCLANSNTVRIAEASEAHGKYDITVTENGKEYSSTKVNEVTYNAKDSSVDVSVSYDGADYKSFTVKYQKDGKDMGEEKPHDAGSYKILVAFDDYTAYYDYKISPAPVTVHVDGNYNYIYTGSKYGRTVSITGVYSGDSCSVKTTYSYIDDQSNRITLGAGELPVSAHTYRVEYALNNANYTIANCVGNSPYELEIAPKELVAKADDVTVSYGETPEFNVTVSGFVNGEDTSVIARMPEVKANHTAVGAYLITPSGGEAGNYTFVYKSGTLTINALEASGTIADTATELRLNGIFAPNTVFVGASIDVKSDEGKAIIEDVRDHNAYPSFGKAISAYTIGTENGALRSELVSITMTNITLDAKKTYTIISISPSGVVKEITKYSYSDGTLSFNSYGIGTFLIIENRADLATWLWIGLGLIALTVLLIVASRVQYIASKRDVAQAKRKKRRGKSGYEW